MYQKKFDIRLLQWFVQRGGSVIKYFFKELLQLIKI